MNKKPTNAAGWSNIRLLLLLNDHRFIRVWITRPGGYIIRTMTVEQAVALSRRNTVRLHCDPQGHIQPIAQDNPTVGKLEGAK